MFRLTLAMLGVILLFAPLSAGAQSILEKSKSGATVRVPTGEPNMAEAMQRAKARLPEFLKLAKAPAPETTGFAVKIGIPYDGGREFVWMNALEFRGENI